MIKEYDKFIIEKKLESFRLLLETYLYGSGEFLQKIKQIKKERGMVGEIADLIYDYIVGENYLDDRDVKQNFFDLTSKDDMVSFLMQNKVPDDWDEEVDPSLPYNTRGRGEIKIGKVIKYIISVIDKQGDLTIPLPKDKDIEQFVNIYKSISISTEFKFKLVKGDDIAKYYNKKRYLTENGSLGNSCMADESKGTFKVYSQNESKVQLLIYIDEKSDKISGRALVWKLKDSPCEARYFMDRVYTNSDSDFFKFRQYAEEKGFLYKQKMNSIIFDNVKFRYKGGDVYGEIKVKLDGAFKNYPFVDTLCFLSEDKKYLSNLSSKNCLILHSVSGQAELCMTCNGTCLDCENCNYDGEADCPDCSLGCETCNQTGVIECDHKGAAFCEDCSVGHSELRELNVDTELRQKYHLPK